MRELIHQLGVDMYAKIEAQRLLCILLHQQLLRVEDYIHLRDAIGLDANIKPQDNQLFYLRLS